MRLTHHKQCLFASTSTRFGFPFDDIEMLIKRHQFRSKERESAVRNVYENYTYDQLLTLISEFDLIIRRLRILVKSFYAWANLNDSEDEAQADESITLFALEFMSSIRLTAEDFDSICTIRKCLLKAFLERGRECRALPTCA